MRIKTAKSILGPSIISYRDTRVVSLPISPTKRKIKMKTTIAPSFIIYNR